ncbi:hypothetical protein Rwratislav_47165 [Rhodococcus wratislaviensis IFP 2016]|nr:hypothetical protein Rwratislav_47165 [Rhodococcus wratislaviensis IFP 2016]
MEAAVTTTLDPTLIQRIDSHRRRLRQEIDERNAELRSVAARTLAMAAQSVDSTAEVVTVHGIDSWFAFAAITCTGTAGQTATVTGLPVEVLSLVTGALSSLRSGHDAAPWQRTDDTVRLNVAQALDQAAGFPFRSVQERILAVLEEQTGKTIRTITITTEEYDNGYFPASSVEVDCTDGDSDEVYFDALEDGEYLDELTEIQGQFGHHTTLTIRRTATGITID